MDNPSVYRISNWVNKQLGHDLDLQQKPLIDWLQDGRILCYIAKNLTSSLDLCAYKPLMSMDLNIAEIVKSKTLSSYQSRDYVTTFLKWYQEVFEVVQDELFTFIDLYEEKNEAKVFSSLSCLERLNSIEKWVEDMVCENSQEDFMAWIRNGRVLCILANKLSESNIIRVKENTNTFQSLESINSFLRWCRDSAQLNAKDMFSTVQLYEEMNYEAVSFCLSALQSKYKHIKPQSSSKNCKKISPKKKNSLTSLDTSYSVSPPKSTGNTTPGKLSESIPSNCFLQKKEAEPSADSSPEKLDKRPSRLNPSLLATFNQQSEKKLPTSGSSTSPKTESEPPKEEEPEFASKLSQFIATGSLDSSGITPSYTHEDNVPSKLNVNFVQVTAIEMEEEKCNLPIVENEKNISNDICVFLEKDKPKEDKVQEKKNVFQRKKKPTAVDVENKPENLKLSKLAQFMRDTPPSSPSVVALDDFSNEEEQYSSDEAYLSADEYPNKKEIITEEEILDEEVIGTKNTEQGVEEDVKQDAEEEEPISRIKMASKPIPISPELLRKYSEETKSTIGESKLLNFIKNSPVSSPINAVEIIKPFLAVDEIPAKSPALSPSQIQQSELDMEVPQCKSPFETKKFDFSKQKVIETNMEEESTKNMEEESTKDSKLCAFMKKVSSSSNDSETGINENDSQSETETEINDNNSISVTGTNENDSNAMFSELSCNSSHIFDDDGTLDAVHTPREINASKPFETPDCIEFDFPERLSLSHSLLSPTTLSRKVDIAREQIDELKRAAEYQNNSLLATVEELQSQLDAVLSKRESAEMVSNRARNLSITRLETELDMTSHERDSLLQELEEEKKMHEMLKKELDEKSKLLKRQIQDANQQKEEESQFIHERIKELESELKERSDSKLITELELKKAKYEKDRVTKEAQDKIARQENELAGLKREVVDLKNQYEEVSSAKEIALKSAEEKEKEIQLAKEREDAARYSAQQAFAAREFAEEKVSKQELVLEQLVSDEPNLQEKIEDFLEARKIVLWKERELQLRQEMELEFQQRHDEVLRQAALREQKIREEVRRELEKKYASNQIDSSKRYGDQDIIKISFEDAGPLGLELNIDFVSGKPKVSRILLNSQASKFRELQVGYTLEEINGIRSDDATFKAIQQMLISDKRPIMCCFKK